jgi:hypothetical protein
MKKVLRTICQADLDIPGAELDDKQEEIGVRMKKITITALAVITTMI